MTFLLRFILLIVASALLSFGVLLWQATGFRFDGLLDFTQLHPLHVLALGIAALPVTLWEIFQLEAKAQNQANADSD